MPFRDIEDPAKLRRLIEASLLLQADLTLPVLLNRLVEEACAMACARYGALGVLDESGTGLSTFITAGVGPEVEREIGHFPTGKGLLGLLIAEPRPIRLANLHTHPESVGFPPHHPEMTSFLGVPVTSRGTVFGNLYLTDKIGWSEFTADDEAMVKALAQAAGIAIENARLHAQARNAAVFKDRDRIARDLHDVVIQRLFAVGLSLQALAATTEPTVASRIASAVSELDDTIRQIRSSIFELASAGTDVDGVRAAILSVVHDLAALTGFEVSVAFDGPIDAAVTPALAEHLVATVREAITNVARHAEAKHASLIVAISHDECLVSVTDDGRGMGRPREGGLGLENLRRRGEALGGSMEIGPGPGGRGTTLTWRARLEG